MIFFLILGAPSEEWLSQEITSADSPFLKGNVPSIQAHRKKNKGDRDILYVMLQIISVTSTVVT